MRLFIPLLFICSAPFIYANQYVITDFGAVNDKTVSSRSAIQAAIDACHQAGGGEVVIPPGNYLSGQLTLRSHVELQLSSGATLWANKDKADYDGGSRGRLLTADGATSITISGRGTIHGQGEADYGARWGVPDAPAFRTGVILFENCEDVVIRDLTILYSDSWTVHLKRCKRVWIDGVTIHNNIRRLNSDGIDPNSCQDVRISNCHIIAGDDCIVFKSTEAFPCERITVTNCILETTATALKLGTESQGDFRDIRVSNCVIHKTRTGVGFMMKDGATMERVSFSNLSIHTLPSAPIEGRRDVYPIFMDIEKRHEDSPVGKIRDISFRDIQIHSGSGILIQGMPERPIENLTIQNITLRADWLDEYTNRKKAVGGSRTTRDERDTRFAREAAYMAIAYVRGLTVDHFRVVIDPAVFEAEERSAFYGHEIDEFKLNGLFGDSPNSVKTTSIVRLDNCRHGVVSQNIAPRLHAPYLRLSGARTVRILLAASELSRSDMLITADDDVIPGEFKVSANFELLSRNEQIFWK